MTNRKPTFKVSAATIACMEALRALEPGQEITHAVLMDAIDIDVTEGTYRAAIASARRALRRDHRMVFSAVVGHGYRRLTDAEIVNGRSDEHAMAIRRRAKNALCDLRSADHEKLDKDTRSVHLAKATVFSVLERTTAPKSLRRIELEARTGPSSSASLTSYVQRLIGEKTNGDQS